MKHLKTLTLLAAALILAGCGGGASIKEVKHTMKTYAYSDPDPVINPDALYYPYYQFEGYSDVAQDKEWKVVEMENEYVKLYIFPEIGGKIWGAVEKKTGNEFIYFNHVVKFRQVAMRGPWTSGGIEFNYGIIGHVPTTSSPIDYAFRTNADGSVSCFLGARELITDTEWSVEVNLEKDKGYFTTETFWQNISPLSQTYYHWMNAGYKASDDLSLHFPGTNYIGHSGDLHSWPVNEKGREIDQYAKNDFGGPKSYHVLGAYSNYYGAYWKDREFGSVHYSPYDEKLGMKVWIWGLSRQGMIWEDLLTDTDGQYVELQSGRMYNQPGTTSMYTPFKHYAFEPHATDRWCEYWYPVKQTDGMVESNRYGALNVKRDNGVMKLYFCPTQKINAQIKVTAKGATIYNKTIKAGVLETWSDSFQMTDPAARVTVTIGDDLLVYSEQPEDNNLSRPMVMPEGYDANSVHGMYAEGRQWMNIRDFDKAESLFKRCLEADPWYTPALNDMGEILYRRGNFDQAVESVRKSMSINAYDPAANMIYGLAHAKLGHKVDAKDGFSIAARTPAYRSAAYLELAKEFAKEQKWAHVKEYASKAFAANPESLAANELQILAQRKSGNDAEAVKLADALLEKHPLNHVSRFEKYLVAGVDSRKDGEKFINAITNELPHETMLAIADWYESMNAYTEANVVLLMANYNPVSAYRQAYILHKMGEAEKAAAKLTEAAGLSAELVAPHGLQTVEALQWAVSVQGGWPSAYYLGLAQWSVGKKGEASELLDTCGDNVPFAPFYMCRAQLREGDAKFADLKRAEAIEKSWRAGLRLIEHTYAVAEYDMAYDYAKEYIKLFPENYRIGLKYAQTMLTRKEYTECVDYLQKLIVLPNEGAMLGRYVYRDACLLKAVDLAAAKDYDKAMEWVEKSKIWPENLGVGKPYDEDIDQRAENFLMAYCYQSTARAVEAKAYYEKVVNGKQPTSSNLLLASTAYERLGNAKQAIEAAKLYKKISPSRYEYAVALRIGNKAVADALRNKINTANEVAAWENQGDNAYDLNVVAAIAEKLYR